MTEKKKLRWFQFSLRTLLVFALLVSIGMSWLGVKMDQARKRREAVEAIEKVGGEVFYDYQSKNRSAGPATPKWAHATFGDDFFFDVIKVWVDEADFGDDEAVYLKRLTNLSILEISGTQVTDAGLEHLKGLTKLEWLDLRGTQVTDAGLEHLDGLTNLGILDLSGTQVTDTGQHLKRLTKLESLDLSGTQVTDVGLEHLDGLTNLWRLDLSGTQVTDVGLEHLKRLTNLGCLILGHTQVSTKGMESLRKALPNCEIRF